MPYRSAPSDPPAPSTRHLLVHVGKREWRSDDGGRTWSKGRHTPPVPLRVGGVRMSHFAIGADGVGLASASERVPGDPDKKRIAVLHRTRDGGASWDRLGAKLSILGRLRAGAGWPPEEIDSLAVQPGGLVAFAWEDPWLFEWPRAHLLASADGGDSWRYARLADGCWRLARASGPALWAFGVGAFCRTSDAGRTIRKARFRVDWPDVVTAETAVRDVHMTSESSGLALVYREDASFPTPRLAIARTEDGARTWTVFHSWEVPRTNDPNERGHLGLVVG